MEGITMVALNKKSKANIEKATGLKISQIYNMSLGQITRTLESRKGKSFPNAKIRNAGPTPRGNVYLNRNRISNGKRLTSGFHNIKPHKH